MNVLKYAFFLAADIVLIGCTVLCVSTVSIVCSRTEYAQSRARGKSTLLANGAGQTRVMLFEAGSGRSPDVADAADGADDISAHPDYPVSGPAFSTEGNLDAVRPKKGLRPAQVVGEGAAS